MEQPLFLDSTPTPSPVSAVQRVGRPALPAPGMRRLLVGWSNSLAHVYSDVVTLDDARAIELNTFHASAVAAAAQLPVVSLAPSPGPLSQAEEAWVGHVSATPRFRTTFGLQGWRVARVALSGIVAWQPIVDAPVDDAPPLENEEQVIRGLLPEPPLLHPTKAALSPDGQGGVRALLTSSDPNHDVDISLEDEGAGGLRIKLRPRTNVVFAMPVNGRLVLFNGYNRLARLAAAGHADAPVLLLDPGHTAAGPVADRPGFLPLNLVVNLPRPPVLTDFLNSALTIDIPKPQLAKGHEFRIAHAEFPVRT